MKPEFSFNYGEKRYVFSAENNAKYDLESGISVSVEVRTYKEYDAVEWVLQFENSSDHNSAFFSNICDCDTLLPLNYPPEKRPGYMPQKGDAAVITMTGMVDGSYYWENDSVSATEYGINYEYLDKAPNKTKRFESIGCRSSQGMMPFFDVTASGAGYVAAIGWTGDWRAEFAKNDPGIRIKTGLKETRFYIMPGEKLRTSSVLIMKYGKDEDKYNKFRRLIKNHFSHKSCTGDRRDGLMACELWGGLPSEEMKKRLKEFKKYDIKFEDIWIDAGWYGTSTKCDDAFSGDWAVHTGEWEVNTRVHPEGLSDVAECAKDAGAALMLWFEPERAIQGSPVTVQHPEWFLRLKGNGNTILNYGNEEAYRYVLDLISHYTRSLELSCYRQDFNVDLVQYFKENDEENRCGITEIKHIMGMYALWDALLAEFPHLIIDNCASGGRRIDIETLKRSIPFFRSDYQCNFNENPEVLQTHNSGISKYLPYSGCTSKTKGDTYTIRSSYSSSWGGAFYNAVFQSMDEEDLKWVKKITDEYRSIRKYFSLDFYDLGASVFDDTAWAIWQYHDPKTQSGIVMAFRRCNSPFDRVNIGLNGLLENRTYQAKNLNNQETMIFKNSLEILLPQKRSSVIFEYQLK